MFLDAARLLPREMEAEGMGFFEGRSCQGLFYCYGYAPPVLPPSTEVEAAFSKAREGYSIRALGHSGAALFEYGKKMYEGLRPAGA